MIIFIDQTITAKSPFNTGIQRTVRKLINYAIRDNNHTFNLIELDNLFQRNKKNKKRNKLLRVPHFIQHACFVILNKIRIYNFFQLLIFRINLFFYFNKKDLKNSIYLNIDSNWSQSNLIFMKYFKKKGGKIVSIYYDNGPFLYPSLFHKKLVENFSIFWNQAFELSDLIICISKTVSLELKKYIKLNFNYSIEKSPNIDYFYLGSDFTEISNLNFFNIQPIKKNYLVVGSIEPRKNNRLIFESFEDLLKNELFRNNINLIFIFNNTWFSEDLLSDIKNSIYFNHNIFLLNDVNDRELRYFYESSYALLNASIYEGFGLGISEALSYKIKVFCNDISVYREIFSDSVIFFENKKESLIKQIKDDFKSPVKIKINNNIISWKQSYQMLISKIQSL